VCGGEREIYECEPFYWHSFKLLILVWEMATSVLENKNTNNLGDDNRSVL
jgi:hypothetical protein